MFPGLDLQKHVIPIIEPRSYAINQRSGTSHQTVPKKGDSGMSMVGVSVATMSCLQSCEWHAVSVIENCNTTKGCGENTLA